MGTKKLIVTDTLLKKMEKECVRLLGVSLTEVKVTTIRDHRSAIILRLAEVKGLKLKVDASNGAYYQLFKRAFAPSKGKVPTKSINSWDFLCHLLLGESYTDAYKKSKSGEEVIEIMDKRKAHATKSIKPAPANSIVPELNLPNVSIDVVNTTSIVVENRVKSLSYHGFTHVTQDFWSEHIVKDVDIFKVLTKYYTHLDSREIPKVVANENCIVPPKQTFKTTDVMGVKRTRTIAEIMEQALSNPLHLVKILSDGGTGKSTFLNWIAKQYTDIANVFFIERIYSRTGDEIIKYLEIIDSNFTKPVLFIIDNVAEEGINKGLDDFTLHITKTIRKVTPLVFIIAERTSRSGLKLVDRYFEDSIEEIEFEPTDKVLIFDRVFEILLSNYPDKRNNLAQDYENLKRTFTNPGIPSISENIFALLTELNETKDLGYKFDWHDWDLFVKQNPQFQNLSNLFLVVSVFNQFGIKLPISYTSPSLRVDSILELKKALDSFDKDSCPIRLEDDEVFTAKLLLKHEKVAEWYLSQPDIKRLALEFFTEFLNNVQSKEAAWLLRQFRKLFHSQEFVNSQFNQLLDTNKYVSCIKKYLEFGKVEAIEDAKMRMEMGMILLKKNPSEALRIFEGIANDYKENNHARDQLAKIYRLSPNTYTKSLEMYFEILKNPNGEYALYRLYQTGIYFQSRGITFINSTFSDFKTETIMEAVSNFPVSELNKTIKFAIAHNDFTFAEQLLALINNPDTFTAQNCADLAFSLPNHTQKIETKKNLLLKAMEIHSTCNNGNENFLYVIDYAVLLYITRKIAPSKEFLDKKLRFIKPELAEFYRNIYWQIIRTTPMFIFENLPPTSELVALEEFLSRECKEAAALVNYTVTNIEVIRNGLLIFKTVQSHSRDILPYVYDKASKSIAYCYAKHSEKGWNLLTPIENRKTAEYIYDRLIEKKCPLNRIEQIDILINLIAMQEEGKATKAIRYLRILSETKEYMEDSIVFYFRGVAKSILKDYVGAMLELQVAKNLCKPKCYSDINHYQTEFVNILLNIAIVICDSIDNNVPLRDYNLKYALELVKLGLSIKPTPRLSLVKERIRAMGLY